MAVVCKAIFPQNYRLIFRPFCGIAAKVSSRCNGESVSFQTACGLSGAASAAALVKLRAPGVKEVSFKM
jgi:hypothetical protein